MMVIYFISSVKRVLIHEFQALQFMSTTHKSMESSSKLIVPNYFPVARVNNRTSPYAYREAARVQANRSR